jgi:hypothetical protein
MIPKYPFRVIRTQKAGLRRWREEKSFESLSAAVLYAELEKRRPSVTSVDVAAVLQSWTRGDPE